MKNSKDIMKDNGTYQAISEKLNTDVDVKSIISAVTPHLSHQDNLKTRHKAIKSFKAKANARRSASEKFADMLTAKFGSVVFLSLNALWFAIWITINTGLIPGVEPFDPFPFGLLTMVVSLEAIFLAIIVLISQNREARIGELREEIDLQINTITESEITKLIHCLTLLLKKQGISLEDDPELQQMLKPINNEALQRQLEKELDDK
jgi:uncharacterized membrane protein